MAFDAGIILEPLKKKIMVRACVHSDGGALWRTTKPNSRHSKMIWQLFKKGFLLPYNWQF